MSKADEGMMQCTSSELCIMRFFIVFSVMATVVLAPSISTCKLILTQLCRYTTEWKGTTNRIHLQKKKKKKINFCHPTVPKTGTPSRVATHC